MSLRFHHFEQERGDGAREHFENFVVATVKVMTPSARPIRANPGDWGIDAYVGSLAHGAVAVWQAKFFLREFGDAQKAQIRDSYEQVQSAAEKEDFELVEWTLCIPENLDGPNQKWWDTWSRSKQRADNVRIRLWNLAEFQTLMAKPDAADVRQEYFGYLPAVHEAQPPPVAPVPPGVELDGLLFVRQLQEAGHVELDSSKEQFYNAELVARDLADKGLLPRLEAFRGLRADLRSTWEDRFNQHVAAVPMHDRLLPALHPDVMERVDQAHDSAPHAPFPLTKTHRKGALQQVVEAGDAGWVRDFRDVAKAHRGQ